MLKGVCVYLVICLKVCHADSPDNNICAVAICLVLHLLAEI